MPALVVLQPSYLPWLGYFEQMDSADVFVFYDDVQFDKNGWRNRNRIKTAQGAQWLTVPVRHGGLAQRILDVEVDSRTAWTRKHLAGIRQAYAKAPFLERYYPELEAALQQPEPLLADLDIALSRMICGWLGITTPTERASALDCGGERNERLIALCRRFGADRYLSGAAARDYLDVAAFAAAGIAVSFQDFRHPEYPQLHGPFVPYLSVLDLVLNCGDDSAGILRSGRCWTPAPARAA
jgi:hypothetical protein